MRVGTKRGTPRARTSLLSVVASLLLIFSSLLPGAVFAAPSPTGATIASDLPDYNPGGTVTLTGTGWAAFEAVRIVTNDTLGQTWQRDVTVTADGGGNVVDVFQLPNYFVSDYDVTASGPQSGVATTTFTDANPSADLDQCANGQAPSPAADGCDTTASDWVNGNLNGSKAVYYEGDSIPYRMRFDNLSLASHTVTIEWDTTQNDKHAIDFLTSYNRTVTTANPCLGVAGCGASTTFVIPADPQVTGAGVTPVAGNFTLFGGTITAVSAYSYPDGPGFLGNKTARITITFTASQSNPVLAWGGHISTRLDWGLENSAVTINGSPYHMRLIDLDGSGGNQDRSLSADAVVFPGSITIVKDATPNGATAFSFTASPAPLANFSLVDDGTSANTKTFSNITNFTTYTVSEGAVPAGWGFDSASCAVNSANGGSSSVSGATATLNMNEGENYTCTFYNSQRTGTLTVIKHVVNDNGGTAVAGNWSLSVKSGGADVTGSPAAGSETGTQYTLIGGAYNVSESGGPSGYAFTGFSGDCDASGNVTLAAGQNKTCTLTNDDVAPKLHLRKVVTNDNGGTATVTDFTLTANGTGANDLSGASPVDSTGTLKADTWALSETGPAGYTGGAWSCSGGTQNGSSVTVGVGGEATCTITNDDNAAHLKLVKTVTNDDGGTAVATDFTLSASGPTPLSGAGGVESDVSAGQYTLSETGVAGYTAGAWSCVGGSFDGTDKVTLALGESATCTINNNDNAAHLKLVKVVVNDNGGTKLATAFKLSANGPQYISGLGGTESDVDAGTYTLAESFVSGYAASGWSCTGGSFDGTDKITLALGESATCAITNDDMAPKLNLLKIVVNDNGGTAVVADFTLTADGAGANDVSGTSGVTSGPTLQADTFALSESGPAGYAASAWSCSGGTQNGSSITLGIGQSATCTITNDDIAPVLKLRKVVVNDNGGTKTIADFTLTANGTGSNDLSGTSPVDSTGALKADTFALSETSVYGYSASAWSCAGGSQSGSNVTLKVGESATCTITNNDQPGTIVIVKNALPQSGVFSFNTTGSTSGPGTSWPSTFTLTGSTASNGNKRTFTVDAGSYSVTESTQLGWTLTGIGNPGDSQTPYNCQVTGSGGSAGSGDVNTGAASITVKNGDTVTCAFENTGNGATRTQGFWQTHPELAQLAWFGGTGYGHTFPGVAGVSGIGNTTLCNPVKKDINTLGRLMGGFWSDISKTSTSKKRSSLDQSRMQLLQQMLAAELNASAFGSVPSGGMAKFGQWEAAYCGTDQNAIKNAQSQAAAFNSQGDSSMFTPGTSANSKYARSIADIKFWDVLP